MSYNGLTMEAYFALLDSQGGVCAVCLGLNSHGARLSIDHDHSCCPGVKSCGKCVRGLLCMRCNRATGLLRDSAKNAQRLAAYLAAHTATGLSS
jgi:Recombination endonuclease VII